MSKSLIPKLEAIKQRYNEVADLIIQPDVISDQKRYSSLNKEYSTHVLRQYIILIT